MAEPLVVTAAEAGQKLLQYLHRRCGAPQSAIQRWVRTGQVRINGGRCKPFDRVAEGDVVRVPPFALAGGAGAPDAVADDASRCAPGSGSGGGDVADTPAAPAPSLSSLPPPPPVVGQAEGLLVLLKPAGLAVQPGTGHADCVTARLAAQYVGADFLPTPAHRLDRDTSGLLLVATSYARLRALSDAFAAREGLVKEYLAWVAGRWPHEDARTLRDRLEKQGEPGRQKVRRVAQAGQGHAGPDADDEARDAACTVAPLRRGDAASLLLVRLHTGRTHQIRVQLAGRGHPIIGDRKYGGPACGQGMLLHAVRLTLPGGERFSALPDWTGQWKVGEAELP
ncbi:RluA family pseudouridine synthase [Nitratidesulfovibrio sp. HK-II]|uniref:RluA family pseudouridine synthase n=1 Tax=Nitratidesulfovibrio sp. HK-II TaxID=2009266 RepID=UPI000E2FE3FD|nr:RluA family pseudouridine synthase [Nitratidesulfovibrio sp. HK-II]GBO97490.1 ribosomal large subunit pseudouridine synthase C [Nitratidesulfovibrio sp. HK-II]